MAFGGVSMTMLALVAAVVVATVAPTVSALPAQTFELVVDPMPPRAPVGNSSCLTPEQIKELKEAISGIQITLTTTVIALDTAAAAEKNPTTRSNLLLAARIIAAVNIDLVSNLTKIVESACGTCSQIVSVVNETVVSLEETLSRIEPNWRNETVWKVVVAAINDILAIAEDICPDAATALDLVVPRNEPCLNATQTQELKQIIAGIQIVLTAVDVALDIAINAESNPQTKQDLELARRVVQAFSQVLVANLTKIAEEACGTCTQIVQTVSDAIHVLEQTLTRIDPNWQNNALYQAIVQGINQILGYVDQLCPSAVNRGLAGRVF